MLSFEDMKQLLNYKRMVSYVKKNRKDDVRAGVYYIAIIQVLGLAVGFVAWSLSSVYMDLFPAYGEAVGEAYWDSLTMGIDLLVTTIMGFVGSLIGLAATHWLAVKFGGKAKQGEYFYIGGKFMLTVALVGFLFTLLAFIPLVNCLTSILSIAFVFYAFYLFILLASTLFGVSSFKALVAIAVGWIVDAVVTFGLVAVIGAVTGLTLGLELMGKSFGA